MTLEEIFGTDKSCVLDAFKTASGVSKCWIKFLIARGLRPGNSAKRNHGRYVSGQCII